MAKCLFIFFAFFTEHNRRHIPTNYLQHPPRNNHYHMRPAYAPHENLWHRQQSNQELHRRYMMNPSPTADDNDTYIGNNRLSNSGSQGLNGVLNLSYDNQYPEPQRRRRLSYVCLIIILISL